MNNNIVKFAIVGIACAAFCTTTFAAPKGGRPGGNGGPARAVQQTRAPQAMRPAAKPSAAKHAAPARHVNPPAVAKHGHGARPEPRHHAPPTRVVHHHAPPPRVVHHHIPSHARYCARTPVPAWRFGARWAWEWIEEEWLIIVNGVYYYGDGYYYDGYNYYYNGAYHTVPPVPMHA